MNAYAPVFGALLLLGGRVGDLFGRRRTLRVGLVVFTVASLLGGLGLNAEMLIAARGLQGVGAALVAPNVLALIAKTFPVGNRPGERPNATKTVQSVTNPIPINGDYPDE